MCMYECEKTKKTFEKTFVDFCCKCQKTSKYDLYVVLMLHVIIQFVWQLMQYTTKLQSHTAAPFDPLWIKCLAQRQHHQKSYSSHSPQSSFSVCRPKRKKRRRKKLTWCYFTFLHLLSTVSSVSPSMTGHTDRQTGVNSTQLHQEKNLF